MFAHSLIFSTFTKVAFSQKVEMPVIKDFFQVLIIDNEKLGIGLHRGDGRCYIYNGQGVILAVSNYIINVELGAGASHSPMMNIKDLSGSKSFL